jgi:hypothetical protein
VSRYNNYLKNIVMKIKNVRLFREIIKKEIAGLNYSDRNENFVGVSATKEDKSLEYGFFSIIMV